MNDIQKIAEAFRMLASVAFPVSYIETMELNAINAHLDVTKGERARHLLATRTSREAAEQMTCSVAQIYKLVQVRPSTDEVFQKVEKK